MLVENRVTEEAVVSCALTESVDGIRYSILVLENKAFHSFF